jgi:hypothetical protein
VYLLVPQVPVSRVLPFLPMPPPVPGPPPPSRPPTHLHPPLPLLRLRPVEQQRRAHGRHGGGKGHQDQDEEQEQEQVAAVLLRGANRRVEGRGAGQQVPRQSARPATREKTIIYMLKEAVMSCVQLRHTALLVVACASLGHLQPTLPPCQNRSVRSHRKNHTRMVPNSSLGQRLGGGRGRQGGTGMTW